MTAVQAFWAASHDWFNRYEKRADGTYIVWVNSDRPEGGLCPYSDFTKLCNWAGY